jgi:hypothetical protein
LELRLLGAASRGDSLDTTEKEYNMPLSTQVRRDGEPLKLAWGGFHIACMVVAVAADSGQGPYEDNSWNGITGSDLDDAVVITRRDAFSLVNYGVIATTPLNDGSYTLKDGPYRFIDQADGEEFELLPGDKLIAFRD